MNKKAFLYLSVAAFTISCGNRQTAPAEQEIGEDSVFVVDEVANEDTYQIQISPEINTDSVIESMRKDFTFKKDEFDEYGRTWVHPKTGYRNQNAFYCYFQLNDDKSVSNFRFVMQYEDDDWLFIENCVFNIEGENIRFIPSDMKHDNNSRIWEWFDERITGSDINLIRKIANAKSVKVKLNGRQYYDTRTIKPKEIASIKRTLNCYEELGGKFGTY